ncbi:MAG: rRNA maturation RNase YbeY [Chloroflexi bacterium]|nr:rRNA maturation RNase YbeY [Chloroflexota bacterium]
MSFTVYIEIQQKYPVNASRLRRAAKTVLKQLRADSRSQVTLVLTDDASVRRLNLEYRQVASETDVLSFPAGPTPVDKDSKGAYLGDILIAYPYAKRAAKRRNLKVENTVCMLVVHGLLHLLGHNHDTKTAKQAMWKEQAMALASIGIDPAIVELYGGE